MFKLIARTVAALVDRFATVDMTFTPIAADAIDAQQVRRIMERHQLDARAFAKRLGITRGRVHWMRVHGASSGLESMRIRTALAL